jgi:hypothetical protein
MWCDEYVESVQDRVFSDLPDGSAISLALAAIYADCSKQVEHMWDLTGRLFELSFDTVEDMALAALVLLRCFMHSPTYDPFLRAARQLASTVADRPPEGDRWGRDAAWRCALLTAMAAAFPYDPNVAERYQTESGASGTAAAPPSADGVWLLVPIPKKVAKTIVYTLMQSALMTPRDRFCVMFAAVHLLRDSRLVQRLGPNPEQPVAHPDKIWHVLEHRLLATRDVRCNPAHFAYPLAPPALSLGNNVVLAWTAMGIAIAALAVGLACLCVWIARAVRGAAASPRRRTPCAAGRASPVATA